MDKKLSKVIIKAISYIDKNQLVQADNLLTSILINNSSFFDALYLKGIISGMQSKHEECKKYLLKAAKINPDNPYLQYNLAKSFSNLGDEVNALDHHKRAVLLLPNNVDALVNLAYCYYNLHLFAESLNVLNKVIELKPASSVAHSNRGATLLKLNRVHEAIESYEKALVIEPNNADIHNKLGSLHVVLSNLNVSLLHFEKTIELNPTQSEAYNNRGNVLLELKRIDDALSSYDKAIELNPTYAEAFVNRGNLFKEKQYLHEAISSYQKAININPDFAEAHWNQSLCYLLMGDFERGWVSYEWGWKNGQRGATRIFSQPLWLGDKSLKDKKILLYGEQGVGDIIQFSRYVSEVKQLGAYVILMVPEKLFGLLKSLPDINELILTNEQYTQFDFHCPLMSLPLAFKTNINTIPKKIPYLNTNKVIVEKLKKELNYSVANNKTLVGISWKSVAKKVGAIRSIELMQLVMQLDLHNVQYINLQYGKINDEISEIEKVLNVKIIHGSVDYFENIDCLAALIDICDVVISVDNTTVHLAGALGKDTRVLLPFNAEWRWLMDQETSPWYPSVKLYRQNISGNWGSAIGKIKADLECKNFISLTVK